MNDILVVGSEGGIGKSFCNYARNMGHNIIGFDINSSNTDDSYRVDTSDYNSLKDIMSKVNPPKYIVSCPGLYWRKKVEEYSPSDILDIWRSNFLATTNIVKLYLDNSMFKLGDINVVMISSLAGHFGGLDAYYASSKAAIIAFSKSIAREYISHRIRINTIAPGPVSTNMSKVMTDETKHKYQELIPIKRFTRPDEVAHLIYFLCCESPPSINGTVYDIDGGLIRR
ncbi:MAG: SDR family NAD(P)-dependent oxidoreductase [Cellvibrionales bacterium]|nr:SDR family NAD(P)-dependent oxidoreductase [Cellvibrionales bacterium]